MRRRGTALILACCLYLVALQTAGVHVHVSAIGEQTGVHALSHALPHAPPHALPHALSHGGAFDHHHHQADRDVPLLEKPGIGGSKLLPFIVSVVGLMAVALWRRVHSSPLVPYYAKGGRRTRWRPPLRAPPSV